MRVLDLGAHDGFVSAYVADHHDGELHIDGIELHKDAVVIFNRRLSERGTPGVCVVGKAEDAPHLFPAGSYDAVVAYELIEHVPDVDEFLDACEQMVAPGGRIYLSTPNGTFGEGMNPHHLRVYRAVDLAELLRRRGDVQQVAVGQDGIAIASYTPWHATDRLVHSAGEVAIYTGPGWKTWAPPMIESPGGLGGSETACVRLADALTAHGYTVTVYGEVEPGCYGQVVYRHHSTFDPLTPRGAVILSRTPWVAQRPITAGRVLLWMHDTDYGPNLTPQMATRIDKVMVLSDWQRQYVAKMYPFLARKLVVTGNAIEPGYFTPQSPYERDPHRVIYSSSPDRGLDLLLEWWPRVVAKDPAAVLCFCYADVYQAVAESRPEVAAHHQRTLALSEQPNVVNLGALSQPNLASAMLQCGVWVAPSWNTPTNQRFHETYCIGAVEAAAAGLVTVTSNWGALAERQESAPRMKLGGDPAPDAGNWVDAIVWAMKQAEVGDIVQSDEALRTTWDRVAGDFIAQLLDPVAA